MTDTETETTAHPAACPHCGGTTVSVAQPDYLLRPAVLNADGSITIGPNNDASDFEGLTLLFCTGCSSMYPQPASVVERFEDGLSVDYPQSPHKDEPGHIGAPIIWLPLTPGDVSTLYEALDSHEYWQLGSDLPKNDGHVFLPDDEGAERYWLDPDDNDIEEHAEAIDAIRHARELGEFIRVERDRQLAHEPNHTRPED